MEAEQLGVMVKGGSSAQVDVRKHSSHYPPEHYNDTKIIVVEGLVMQSNEVGGAAEVNHFDPITLSHRIFITNCNRLQSYLIQRLLEEGIGLNDNEGNGRTIPRAGRNIN